jgi:DNA-directed RNA polymerase subunit RPC12/RpoP
MAVYKGCPGAVNIRNVRPEYVECSFCGTETEIWTDELVARCPGCGNEITQSRGASCIDWCAYARECVGSDKYERLQQMLNQPGATIGPTD